MVAFDARDEARLAEAVELARRSIGLSDPNPRVGCVIDDASGRRVAAGWTQHAGGEHAEAMALRVAREAGAAADLRGGTAWVTLEPCAHHGRTAPCADALVAAGLARVVVALPDPHPAVAGRGRGRLRAAGVDVVLAPASSDARRAAFDLNVGFFSRLLRGRPWVRAKTAQSLDGFTALPDGRSQWITGAAARADGHAWRARAGAVVTGVGTVLADDPRLDVREVPTRLQPMRIVLDPRWRTPPAARILRRTDAPFAPPPHGVVDRDFDGATWIVGAEAADDAARARRAALDAAGARTVVAAREADGRLDLAPLLRRLAALGVGELHVEAGAATNGALLRAGLVDEWLAYVAPTLLGAGLPVAHGPAVDDLGRALRWHTLQTSTHGDDTRLRLVGTAWQALLDRLGEAQAR